MTTPATVVIIDDQLVIVELLAEFLIDEGYTVFATSDPVEGLAHLRRTPPNILILDLMMPILSGWEILDHLRATSETQQLPVILMTAAPRQAFIEYERRNPSHTLLMPKPVSLDELLLALQRLLEQQEASSGGSPPDATPPTEKPPESDQAPGETPPASSPPPSSLPPSGPPPPDRPDPNKPNKLASLELSSAHGGGKRRSPPYRVKPKHSFWIVP